MNHALLSGPGSYFAFGLVRIVPAAEEILDIYTSGINIRNQLSWLPYNLSFGFPMYELGFPFWERRIK